MTESATATDNVDAAEIQKFADIASLWWDLGGEFKPLHEINPLRLDYIERSASGIAGKQLLDVGCGGGIFAESAALAGADVKGIDMGEAQLEVARLHGLESGASVDYEQVPVEQLAESEAGKYDVVTCLEMLEHVPDPASIIAACAKLVKPGGDVFFSTLNRNPKSYLFAIVGAEYVLRMLKKGTHDFKKFIRPSELANAARIAGLQPLDMVGLTYNPIFKTYALKKDDIDVNYIMHWRRPE